MTKYGATFSGVCLSLLDAGDVCPMVDVCLLMRNNSNYQQTSLMCDVASKLPGFGAGSSQTLHLCPLLYIL